MIEYSLRHIRRGSIFWAMLVVMLVGMVVPAVVGGAYVLTVHEARTTREAISETVEQNLAILSQSLAEPLWHLDQEPGLAIAEAIFVDASVVRLRVMDSASGPFLQVERPERRIGNPVTGEQEITYRGQRIGRVYLELDDGLHMKGLQDRQRIYAITLLAQVMLSLLLVLFLVNHRLLRPLRHLMDFAESLAAGNLNHPPGIQGDDELGLLGRRLDEMRLSLKQAFEALKSDEERLRLAATVFENTAEGVIITDPQARILAVNRAFSSITGYSEADVIGQSPRMLQSGRQDAAFYAAFWQALEASGTWRGEIWNRRKDGSVYPEWLTVSAVRNAAQAVTHYVGVFSDITSVKASQERLEYQAHHDALTDLPNRVLASDRLDQAIRHAQRDGRRLAVLFIDLDHFKNVNDTLGHHAGDELLIVAARRLQSCLRSSDTLARLGGDEFLVVSESIIELTDAGLVAQRLNDQFAEPLAVAGQNIYISASIGIALFPEDGSAAETLVRNADTAMYQAKTRGRNGYCFYTQELTAQAIEKMQLSSILRHSIANDELRLYYQPQVDMRDSRVVGVEALVRWQHPVLGMVSPVRFIPLAEESGFIQELGSWVLFEACRQWAQWDAAGFRVDKMAVNLSVKQLESGAIIEAVKQVLQETGMDPACLQLEVTESVIMATDNAMKYLVDLRSLGVQLAIDDFGTGYSSLAYLNQLPVQTLKIDRTFVTEIASDPNNEAIALAIIQLARSMKLSVVAEGVETEDQARLLMGHECAVAQGFLYGRPMEAEMIFSRWGTVQPG